MVAAVAVAAIGLADVLGLQLVVGSSVVVAAVATQFVGSVAARQSAQLIAAVFAVVLVLLFLLLEDGKGAGDGSLIQGCPFHLGRFADVATAGVATAQGESCIDVDADVEVRPRQREDSDNSMGETPLII